MITAHRSLNPTLALRITALALAVGLFLLPAQDAHADVSLEVKGSFGFSSATHDMTQSIDDPILDIGGGGMLAALIDLGGFWVGLDFRYWYESHFTRSANNTNASGGVMSFSVPSAGLRARFDLMPAVNVGIWANFAFGSAAMDNNQNIPNNDLEWAILGLDAGLEANYNYKLGAYKTYILFGLFAQYQYLQLRAETDSTPSGTTSNIGAGVNLGARFDFGI